MPKAIEAARRSVALDTSLAEGHNALAMACLMGSWDRTEARREFDRALQLNPKYTQAMYWYAAFFLQLSEGRLMEGMEQARAALAGDSLSGYGHAMFAMTCLVAGKTGEGLEAARRAVELDQENYLARFILQEGLRVSGRFEEAVAMGEVALAKSGRHEWSMMVLALTLADWDKAEDADAVYSELQARACRQYVSPATLAIAASAAAREEEAIAHARKAYEIRDPNCQNFFKYFSSSGRLEGHPWLREFTA